VFADAGYTNERVSTAALIVVEIVRKQPGQVGFAVHHRQWMVERLLAWLGRNQRLFKDCEATLASATTFLYAASALLLTRRLARR
jgi:putative transposase